MIDTLRFSTAGVRHPGQECLTRNGWRLQFQELSNPGEFRTTYTHDVDGVYLRYHPAYARVSAECNVPKLTLGDNAQLAGWSNCQDAAHQMVNASEQALDQSLPDAAEWQVARIDTVYAWPVDPAPYLSALALARLPRSNGARYETGVIWKSRANNTLARAYDKSAEERRSVALPLRLERQCMKPYRNTIRTDQGQKMSSRFGSWTGERTLGVLRWTYKELGMDQPVRSASGAREALIDKYGKRKGTNLFSTLASAYLLGGWEYVNLSPNRVTTIRRDLAAAGITGVDTDGELDPLPPPAFLP